MYALAALLPFTSLFSFEDLPDFFLRFGEADAREPDFVRLFVLERFLRPLDARLSAPKPALMIDLIAGVC